MLLVLLRHADAGVSDPSRWPDDSDRPLTDIGRNNQRRMSETLRRSGFTLDALFTSPLLRARQTAEIVAHVFELKSQPVICDALAEPPELGAIARCIGGVADRTIGLTGHSPWLDEFASLLLTGAPDTMRTEFAKSAVMVIHSDAVAPGAGELLLFLPPDIADS